MLALTALVAGVSRLVAERAWWGTLLLYPPQHYYLVPVALTLLASILSRRRQALLPTTLLTAMVLGPVMGFCVPWAATQAQGERRVRILTYNIRGAEDGFAPIQEQIRRYQPDLVVFTEVRGWPREADLRQELDREFQGWSQTSAGDVWIACRWPIVKSGDVALGPQAQPEESLNRRMAWAAVDSPHGRFRVAGVHFHTAMRGMTLSNQRSRLPFYLRHTAQVRLEQAHDVLAFVESESTPVILAGDFDSPPAGRVYGALTSRFSDSFAEAGWGWGHTYPSLRPMLRIDYIFHTHHWAARRAEVGGAPGSDHGPVFAELVWSGRRSESTQHEKPMNEGGDSLHSGQRRLYSTLPINPASRVRPSE